VTLAKYFHENLNTALKDSWRGANGLAGAGIAGVGLIWPGLQKIISAPVWWAEASNWLISFIIYAIAAWLFLLLFQFIFISPYKIWQHAHEKTEFTVAEQIKAQRAHQVVEHDKQIAAKFREIFPENQKQKLLSDLLNQHAYWDKQAGLLNDAGSFLAATETYFLNETLREKSALLVVATDKLLEFMGLKFFVYPRDQRTSPTMFAMQPNLNIDREGNGTPEQYEKYDKLTEELDSRANEVSDAYNNLIRSFHIELLQ